MKTPILFTIRMVLRRTFPAIGLSVSLGFGAAQADTIVPLVPVISISATVPETREPFCDPAICDALVPAPGVFTVSRVGGDLTHELAVFVSYGGTATNGTDYDALPTFVSFPAGVKSVDLLVQASYDKLTEGDETVVAELQPDRSLGPIARYQIDSTQAAARITIHDNDTPAAPVLSIQAIRPIAEESSYPFKRLPLRGRFLISRTGPTDDSMTAYVHYGGTATPGLDYPALPWIVSLPAGTNQVEIDVVPTPDDIAEPLETVEATLSECPPNTIPPMGIPCFLVNIDPAHSSARIFIRDEGITTASLEITDPAEGADFQLGATIPVAATAIDLAGAITRVEFFDEETLIGESAIDFFRQPDPGTPIYHQFDWNGAGAGPHILTARALDAAGNAVTSAPIHLRVSAGPPLVSIKATVPETTEPSPTTRVRPGVFTFRRTGDTNQPLTVWYLLGGTASNGEDYERLSGQTVIPAGLDAVDVLVQGLPDDLSEGDETVVAQLFVPPFALLIDPYRIDPANSKAVVIIHDSPSAPPAPPVVSIVATDPFAREGTNSAGELDTATFVISRSGPTNDSLSVQFQVSGTASNGVDYLAVAGPLVVPAGQRKARLVIVPMDDRQLERVETIIITLGPSETVPPVYTVGAPRRAAAIIVDNDRPRPRCMQLADGLFNLCIPFDLSDCFRVEVTRDFSTWAPVCTVPVNAGMAHFVDPDAPAVAQKFYRLVPVPCEP